ncbi:phage terminase small subunit P27 family [Liquorilactobacillus hordei]|uniref:phage terminase small subunit P27 family n=1 Tax=Liquorilactobacillus hordei TaxID=468911 RepID=UPI0039EBB7B5
MAGRKVKLTTDESDRKDQRDRTQKLIDSTKDMDALQSSPPRLLKGKARYIYTRLQPLLAQTKYVKQADLQTVILLCIQIEEYQKAYEHLQEHDQVQATYKTVVSPTTGKMKTDFTGYKKDPSIGIIDTCTAKIRALSTDLGLNPESRASLLKINDGDKDAPSMEEMRKAFGA